MFASVSTQQAPSIDPVLKNKINKTVSDLNALYERTSINSTTFVLVAGAALESVLGKQVSLVVTPDHPERQSFVIGDYTYGAENMDHAVALHALQSINDNLYTNLTAMQQMNPPQLKSIVEYETKLIALLGGREAYDFIRVLTLPHTMAYNGGDDSKKYRPNRNFCGFEALRDVAAAVKRGNELVELHGDGLAGVAASFVTTVLDMYRAAEHDCVVNTAPQGFLGTGQQFKRPWAPTGGMRHPGNEY